MWDRLVKTILLVEDDSDTRMVYRDALGYAGYRVLTAVHGAEGVHLARRHRPDLILMDIRMPVMDGFTALRYIKTGDHTRAIPVWGITAAQITEQEWRESAPDDFDRLMPKPPVPAQLVGDIDEFFGFGSRHGSPTAVLD